MKYVIPSIVLVFSLLLALIVASLWGVNTTFGTYLFFTGFMIWAEAAFAVLILEIAGIAKTDEELSAHEAWIADSPLPDRIGAYLFKVVTAAAVIFVVDLCFTILVNGTLRLFDVTPAGALAVALMIVRDLLALVGAALFALHGRKLSRLNGLNRVWVVFRREFEGYFQSPIAYIVISVFLVVTGFLFFQQFFLSGQVTLRPMFELMGILFMIIAPAITMRLIAEEKRAGTIELLMTLPIGPTEIILGKYLAALALMAVGVVLTLPYSMTVSLMGRLDWGPVLGAYIGMLFLGGGYLSIGMICSTWTNSQIIAVIMGWMVCLIIFFLDKLVFFLPSGLAGAAEFLSLTSHFENIARGVIDTRDVIFYLSFIGGMLMLSIHFMTTESWR